VDVLPEAQDYSNLAGLVKTDFAVDAEKRELSAKRVFLIKERDFIGTDQYRILRNLFRKVVSADAATIALILE
jgi:hypothetical protein